MGWLESGHILNIKLENPYRQPVRSSKASLKPMQELASKSGPLSFLRQAILNPQFGAS